MERISLPVFGIVLTRDGSGVTSITTDLRQGDGYTIEFDAAINGLEALILALFSAGIDVESNDFLSAIETAFLAISEQYPDQF